MALDARAETALTQIIQLSKEAHSLAKVSLERLAHIEAALPGILLFLKENHEQETEPEGEVQTHDTH